MSVTDRPHARAPSRPRRVWPRCATLSSMSVRRWGHESTRRKPSLSRSRRGVAAVIAVLASLLCASPASAYIYWESMFYQQSSAIARSKLDGSGIRLRFIKNAPSTCGGIAVDGRYIYWTDGWIARAKLRGSAANENFIRLPGYHYTCAIAVDRHHIYWFDQNALTIGRANLDGTHVNRALVHVSAGTVTVGLAVDHSHVYWLDHSNSTGQLNIGRANLDGSHVNRTFILANASDDGLAVDAGHIYWVDPPDHLGAAAIARASVNGSDIIPDFIGPIGSVCGTMAIHSGYIYWNGSTGIDRASLDGGGIRLGFVPASKDPSFINECGVAVNGL